MLGGSSGTLRYRSAWVIRGDIGKCEGESRDRSGNAVANNRVSSCVMLEVNVSDGETCPLDEKALVREFSGGRRGYWRWSRAINVSLRSARR